MKFFSRFLLLFSLLTFLSCNRDNSSEVDNLFKFKDYISYNTYGNNSIANAIKVELVKPLDQFELTQEIPSEYLIISPKTEGKLLIENGRTLIFQPLKKLIPDT